MIIKAPPIGVSGQFRMVVSSDAEMQDVKHDTGYFDNLITDVGMNRMGTTNIDNVLTLVGRFGVGSGSAVPQFSDTALGNVVAQSSQNPTIVSETSEYLRGYSEAVLRYQFPQGAAAGNLSEIGMRAGDEQWSRALILNALGAPTTLTVLPTDFLTCFYSIRFSIPKVDAVYNIDVDYGEDGIVPTLVTCRPLGANSTLTNGWVIRSGRPASGSSGLRAHTGALVDPTATILSGPIGYVPNSVFEPYIQNSFQKYTTLKAGLADINSSNLRSFQNNTLPGNWQIEFDPPLVKNNTHTMDLTFGVSWARA